MKIVDILIVGGGIAGLSLTYFLEQTPFDFLLIEKRNEIGKYGNRVISKEAFKKMKLRKSIILHKIKTMNFYSPSLVKLSYVFKTERGYVTNLKNVERNFYEKIQSKENICLGKDITEIDFKKRKAKTQKEEIIRYKHLIIACGINKGFLEKCMITVPQHVFCYAVELKDMKESTSVIFDNVFAKNFYGWIIPLPESIEIGFGSSKFFQNFRIDLFKISLFKQFKKEKIEKINAGIIPINVPPQNIKPKDYFIIGDVLGGEPLFGGSIHKAFDEAKLVAEVLSNTPENPEKKYYCIWKKTFYPVIQLQSKTRKFINSLKNEELDKIFEDLKLQYTTPPESKGLINDLFIKLISQAGKG